MPAERDSAAPETAIPNTTTNPGSSTATARQDDLHSRLAGRAGTRAYEDLPYYCPCGVRWSGLSTSHCGACGRTFSSVGTFDRHRRDGRCLDPEPLGMVLLLDRAYDCWGFTAEATA